MDHDKCWICLSEDGTNWKKVCNCNLRAHEQCILQWAQASDEAPCCPQCRQEIRIQHEPSLLVELRDSLNTVISSVCGGSLLVVALPTIATNTLYNTMYEIGAISIRTMCSPSLANVALGPLWTRFHRFAPFGIPIVPLPSMMFYTGATQQAAIQQSFRQVGIPLIPLWLCSSGKYALWATGVLGALLTAMPNGPEKRSLLAVLIGRYVYRAIWKLTAGKLLRSLANKVYLNTRRDEFTSAMERLDELIDQVRANAAENRPDPNPEEALDQMVEVVEVMEDLDEIDAHRDGLWLLGTTSPLSRVFQGLAAPFVSALLGKLLSNIPRLKAWPTLSRNLLSMCLIVVVKDILGLIVAFRRSQMEVEKRVLNYEDLQSPRNSAIQYITDLNQRLLNLVNFDIRIGVN